MKKLFLILTLFFASCGGSQEVQVLNPTLVATGEYGSELGIASTLSADICYDDFCAPVEVEFFASETGVFVCYSAALFTDCIRVDEYESGDEDGI